MEVGVRSFVVGVFWGFVYGWLFWFFKILVFEVNWLKLFGVFLFIVFEEWIVLRFFEFFIEVEVLVIMILSYKVFVFGEEDFILYGFSEKGGRV